MKCSPAVGAATAPSTWRRPSDSPEASWARASELTDIGRSVSRRGGAALPGGACAAIEPENDLTSGFSSTFPVKSPVKSTVSPGRSCFPAGRRPARYPRFPLVERHLIFGGSAKPIKPSRDHLWCR